MKRRLLFISSVLGLLAVAVTPIQVAAQRQKSKHTRYVITDLGTLGGPGTNSSAFDMNNAGWVAGSGNRFPGGPQHAFLWFGRDPLFDLGGFSETGVEDSTCLTPSMPAQIFRYETVVWEPNGEIRKLRPLHGDTVGFGFGINDQGVAVGTSGLCSNTVPPLRQPNGAHAVLWDGNGSPHDLGNLGGTPNNIATSINNRNEVVGNSESTDGTIHAFVWTRTAGIHDLGTFSGAVATVAPCCNTINDRGQVVGFWFDTMFNARAFLWQDNVLTNLDDLIPKDSPWQLQFAQAINDAGEIVGQGQIRGESHAFLATPCDRSHSDSERCKE